ncbi:MAG: M2 family metallopeptidase [Candidatus Polarisedimenticolia bacterium]|nr:M2 family metallopeptidase [bacterium]
MADAAKPAPTVDEAKRFVAQAEARLLDLWVRGQRADWVNNTYITDDTEILSAQANEAIIAETTAMAQAATRFDGMKLPPDVARKLKLLKLSLVMPAPNSPRLREEETRIVTSMQSDYGKGKYCPKPGVCYDLGQLEEIMASSRDPKQLLDAWEGWRTISPPMRDRYKRFVELSNQGARDLGFADTGALWRSKYDMSPDEFSAEVDRLWGQVQPLYTALHCYVRGKLQEKYGKELVPDGKPIPAHLLGNMWAQSWENVYDLVKPPQQGSTVDLTALVQGRKMDAKEMVRTGERFFMSLGLPALPETFWERSMLVKPRDREVVCHASAWDVDYLDDIRLKMCIKTDGEDFVTVHHELGHNYYQRAYKNQTPLFRDSANDGFHEALGDTLALSITPAYLAKIGFLPSEPKDANDVDLLLRRALEKVSFLPFGLMVDQWRWQVFSGKVTPDHYNQAWWDLARKYQGIAPPVARSEKDFDPGAKYHVAANVPYARYFLAHLLQFQFHRALSEAAGQTGPLHRRTIYGSKAAGERLNAMMEMGQSKPWPEALKAMTGSDKMDASAVLDYFAPLKKWLDEQNKGRACGWD